MKYIASLFVIAWACATAGCSAETEPAPIPADPLGFTFKSAPGSFSSFGWSGAFHSITQGPDTPFGVKTTACRDGLCRFEGPADPRGEVVRRRCLIRTSVMCAADDDCRLDGGPPTPCVYVYDAPTTAPLVGTDLKVGACAWSYIPLTAAGQPAMVAGSLNLTSGALHIDNLTVNLVLNANATTFRGACAECVGDKKPNDGVREGTCQLATHLGDGVPAGPDISPDLTQPCDVHRIGTIDGFEGNYSMDCAPTVLAGSGPPIPLGGSYSSSGKEISLTEESPDCTSGGKCLCGMCANSSVGCMSDNECGKDKCVVPGQAECDANDPASAAFDPTLAPYQCKRDLRRVAVESNRCINKVCNWNPDKGLGTCKTGQGTTIGCYPAELNAKLTLPGSARRDDRVGTVYQVETGGARCVPAANAISAVTFTSQLGLPGLLFQRRNFQIIPEYVEE
jgi:hypothetical protein